MDNDNGEGLDLAGHACAIDEQLHPAYWDGHAARVALVEKKRHTEQARGRRQVRNRPSPGGEPR